ncbi:MAG TPA: MopE-related protein [Polyangiaceae bacterium]|nr:MopE-related protein [Polyangiaceae bacterium]
MNTKNARSALRRRGAVSTLLGSAIVAAALIAPTIAPASAFAAEPAACLSSDPTQWPSPSKPYFMIAFDTSGSMITGVAGASNSCGYPNDRLGHGRCAIKNTIQAFAGQVNFGLASYAKLMTSCPAGACPMSWGTCTFANVPGESVGLQCQGGCGPEPSPDPADSSTRAGANILVPMQRDNYFDPQLEPSNVPELLSWVDDDCTNAKELFPSGCTPMNGMLRDMHKYFSSQWTRPGTAVTYPSPLGTLAQGERPCRSVNVIFVTDGFETCDQSDDAADAAADMFNGFTKGGINWKVKTFVIDFGNAGSEADAIAAAGGTTVAKDATNEATLSAALANIISSAVSPEGCDNKDNNCNGCTDEGFTHYCNTAQTCCSWNTEAVRQTCLSNYKTSINAGNPGGDVTKLPCTTPAQQTDPATWLCFNPRETCDGVDNNCALGVNDEAPLKCGNPAHCPSPEVCFDLVDNDCNGQVDEGCSGCQVSPEICDGCDNDCDGVADDNIAPIPCGLSSPPNCLGQITCKPPVNVPVGTCVAGGGQNACSNNPQAETCDGLDNDCDGVADDNILATACDPAGGPYNYGPNSQCKQGLKPCNGACQGAVGPSPEICDGIDNDCDGQVDESAMGAGQACGPNQAPCQPGVTACVNGALVCQGGTGPQAEVCDGIDNDCDGTADDAPLADGPAAGQTGCWNVAGNCCTFQNVTWCPPQGATCSGLGSLVPPCGQGTLACAGASGWICQGSTPPSGEVCDGIDNDCDAIIDDGSLPMQGEVCGSDKGECKPGTLTCVGGVLDCIGDIAGTQEVCDGLDNDCDGTVDNNIPTLGPCVPEFDTSQFPNTPTNVNLIAPPCQPGTLACDGNGNIVCTGGVGPTPEVCNLVDDDCDGSTDEAGPAPNGINGTPDPIPPPAGVVVGDACGETEGQCAPGQWGCLNGSFACLGGQGPAVLEECDCIDNDCDGSSDEENDPGEPTICSPGKTCVKSGNTCQCAEPCEPELLQCQTAGQECVSATDTGGNAGNYCVPAPPCGEDKCASATVKDAAGNVVCAPAGTVLANCKEPPRCACKGAAGCQNPCYNVVCAPGLVCATHGPNAGTCGLDNCFNIPCSGCDAACYKGQCVPSPCEPNPCAAGEVCKPNATFTDHTCEPSCFAVMCAADEVCKAGTCVKTCSPACGAGEYCDQSQATPVCVPSACANPICVDGSCCDPKTGACESCACEGVVCPAGQQCIEGSCFEGIGGVGGSGGSGGGSAGAGGGTGGAGGMGGAGPGTTSSGAASGTGGGGTWGMPTGGGGCVCEVGAGASGESHGRWAIAALLACALGLRRRRSGRELRASRSAGEEVSR